MLVNSLADSSVLLQQGLSRVLIVPKVLAGDQAVGVLQPGHQVVCLRGELKKIECLLQVVEALRSLVLQPLPLALHVHDALLDPHRAEAFVTQDLFSSLYGVLEKTGGWRKVSLKITLHCFQENGTPICKVEVFYLLLQFA